MSNKYTYRPWVNMRGALDRTVTHAVYRDDMPVWSGTEEECAKFADEMNYEYALRCMIKGTKAEKL